MRYDFKEMIRIDGDPTLQFRVEIYIEKPSNVQKLRDFIWDNRKYIHIPSAVDKEGSWIWQHDLNKPPKIENGKEWREMKVVKKYPRYFIWLTFNDYFNHPEYVDKFFKKLDEIKALPLKFRAQRLDNGELVSGKLSSDALIYYIFDGTKKHKINTLTLEQLRDYDDETGEEKYYPLSN